MKPLCIDLFCGLGGWAEGFLAEGYDVVGFDIERHDYGTGGYPGQLVLQDVLTLHGSQFRNAAVIVASPPCDEFSVWGQRHFHPNPKHPEHGIKLFEHTVEIVRRAQVPFVIENVRAAQMFVGSANAHCGSHYLWCSNPPALLPQEVTKRARGLNLSRDPYTGIRSIEGSRSASSGSLARKKWKAQIAKIPFPLAQHIARVYTPCGVSRETPGFEFLTTSSAV